MYYASLCCNKYRSGCTVPVYLLQRISPRMYYANLRSSQHGSPRMYCSTNIAQDVLCQSICCNADRPGCTVQIFGLRNIDRPGCTMLVSVATNNRSGCTMPVLYLLQGRWPRMYYGSLVCCRPSVCALRRLCLKEGVEESKIDQIVQLDEYVVSTYRCLCTHFCA